MLREVVACTNAALGYKLCYALDVRGKIVPESSGDFCSRVIESKGEDKLFVGVTSWSSHSVQCDGVRWVCGNKSLVLCQGLVGPWVRDVHQRELLWVQGNSVESHLGFQVSLQRAKTVINAQR